MVCNLGSATEMIVTESCVGCGQCVPFCPQNTISVFVQAMIGDRCTNCLLCNRYCPLGAIVEDLL